jgi:hypothetical protein
MDDTQTQHFEKVPCEEILTDKYFEMQAGGNMVAAKLKKHEIMMQAGGFSDEAKNAYFGNMGAMEKELPTLPTLKSHDVNYQNILNLAIRGLSKKTIAQTVGMAERSVEYVLYSERAQTFMRATLNQVQDQTALVLPTLNAQALATLESCLNGTADKSRLQAAEAVFNLIARVERMAAARVTYHTEAKTTKTATE